MKVLATLELEKLRQIGEGEGRNSTVFLANDPQLGGVVVLKEIDKSKIRESALFFEECQKLYASRHPNIAEIHYGCATEKHVCIAMPHYPKGSLAKRIEAGPLPIKDVIAIGVQILTGLGAVHEAGILHLDIKPTNVLFTDSGTAILADFGQAVWLDPDTGLVVNLPPMYARAVPPELLETGRASVLTDIFQVALTLYRAINGAEIYEAQKKQINDPTGRARERAIKQGTFPNRDSFLPHAPQALCNLIRDALAVDPSKRPPNALSFRDKLAAIAPPIDWQVTVDAERRSWIGSRQGRASLHVEHCQSDGIRVFKVSEDGSRRKHKKLCMPKVDAWRADVELRKIFRELSV